MYQSPGPCDDASSALHERRRTLRLRKSSLLKMRLENIDKPSIKIADTHKEFLQSFSLVHDEYRSAGYIKAPLPAGLKFSPHHLLPRTCVFIFKSYLSVISTLTQVFDSHQFGLPMDSLYRKELDRLRDKGRTVIELCSLATPRTARWSNLSVALCNVMFQYSSFTGVNDICIMVNPKHVRFYKRIYLFEEFGEIKHYPAVNAPAVPLRINFDTIRESLAEAYGGQDFDCDLHSYFCRTNRQLSTLMGDTCNVEKNALLPRPTALTLAARQPEAFAGLNPDQCSFIEQLYPGIFDAARGNTHDADDSWQPPSSYQYAH